MCFIWDSGWCCNPCIVRQLQLPRYRQATEKCKKSEKDVSVRHNLCFFLKRKANESKLKRADSDKFSAFYIVCADTVSEESGPACREGRSSSAALSGEHASKRRWYEFLQRRVQMIASEASILCHRVNSGAPHFK